MHLKGLARLGVSYSSSGNEEDDAIVAHVGKQGLHAAQVELPFASVGTTENLMMAATRAQGTTLLKNVAREPEIVDLANFLIRMGARIEGAGSPEITIHGVEKLEPVRDYKTVEDRIVAGTYLVAGALCGGPVTVEDVRPAHLEMPLCKLRDIGCSVKCEYIEEPDGISDAALARVTVQSTGDFKPVDIQTLPYPGFPTDLQPQFIVLNALAQGDSKITENVFDHRFLFVDELKLMGANIEVQGHKASIKGVPRLSGARVTAPDLRAGAGLLLAGLVAEGMTIVQEIAHIERGYDRVVEHLAALGACIERQQLP
jgi:UDP-N-acetylglucosamine 1-carboxyvinyltransferase